MSRSPNPLHSDSRDTPSTPSGSPAASASSTPSTHSTLSAQSARSGSLSLPSSPARRGIRATLREAWSGSALRSYMDMAYGVHWFFAATLLGIVVAIVVFATDTRAILLKQSQMPLAELYDFDIYQASDEAVLFHIQGQKALRFSEYEKSYETILQRVLPQEKSQHAKASKNLANQSPRVIEYIYGPEIVRQNDVYHFDKGGVYAKNSGETFYTKQGHYDAVNGVFTGVGRFWASSLTGSMEGENLIYRQVPQTSDAQHITAIIQLEERKPHK